MKLAGATGAVGYAQTLARVESGAAPHGQVARAIAQGEPKQGGTLRLGFGIGQIPTLDPAQVSLGIIAGELVSNLFSGLVQFDTELGIVADLAETWEVSADGLNYTFSLRDGLTFHNGDPLKAADIIYTFNRTKNPDFASPHANKLALVEDIQAPDELTVTMRLSSPFTPFLAVACSRGPGRALAPISQRAIEELGDEQFGLTPVGCGPFRLLPETAEVGTGFEMDAFAEWYGGRPFLDKIIVQLIPEPSSRISALEAGDVDMLDIVPAIGAEQIAGNGELTMVEAAGTNWVGLAMNTTRPPWDTVEARMAVAKAIDRTDFLQTAFFGLPIPSVGPIAPAFGWVYRPPADVDDPQAYDIDAARALAEQAGLDGVQPILLASSDDPRPAQVIRGLLDEIGIDCQIEQMQTNAYVERRSAGDYDMVFLGSVVDADPDDGTWNYFHSTGPANSNKYNNPVADELVDRQRTITDLAERAQVLQELQTLVATDAPYAFLYHDPDRTAFYNYVMGYVAVPEQRYFEKVWLDK